MDKEEILKNTEVFARQTLEGEGTGHDWWHINRVRNNSIRIAQEEGADLFVVELASLLHDIADWKFQDGEDDDVGPRVASEWLEKQGVDADTIAHVANIIKNISFKGAHTEQKPLTKEGQCVQDGDRLDALGAIGIARCFATGAQLGNVLHEPGADPTMHASFEEYKTKRTSSINHFHEKLFLLKDRMNTVSAKKIAEERHNYMQTFVDTFLKEWG